MYSLTVQNERNEQLKLTQTEDYTVKAIEGLSQPDAVLNYDYRPGHNGSVYNSGRVDNRQLIITLLINNEAAENRNVLYNFFRSSRPVRIFYKNSLYDVYVDGYVQNFTIDFFAQHEIAQIVVLCFDPFWHDIENDIITSGVAIPAFSFPFANEQPGLIFSTFDEGTTVTINNKGAVSTGLIITMRSAGVVEIPRIESLTTGEALGVSVRLSAGDSLIVDTREDHRSITRITNGTAESVISSMTVGSEWITLIPGDNDLIFDVNAGDVADLSVFFETNARYMGV